MEANSAKTIDMYISDFPPEIQLLLEQIRKTIKITAPDAIEAISYGMPTFKLHGNLVHFAAYKNHIGFYPAPSGIDNFAKELSLFKKSKGAVQFPINGPIPLELISKIVKYRMAENLKNAKEKLRKRNSKK